MLGLLFDVYLDSSLGSFGSVILVVSLWCSLLVLFLFHLAIAVLFWSDLSGFCLRRNIRRLFGICFLSLVSRLVFLRFDIVYFHV